MLHVKSTHRHRLLLFLPISTSPSGWHAALNKSKETMCLVWAVPSLLHGSPSRGKPFHTIWTESSPIINYNRLLNNVLFFNIFVILVRKQKKINKLLYCRVILYGACMFFLYLCGFSLYSPASCHIKVIGMPKKPTLRTCGCDCGLWWRVFWQGLVPALLRVDWIVLNY